MKKKLKKLARKKPLSSKRQMIIFAIVFAIIGGLFIISSFAQSSRTTQNFSTDPGWEGRNNTPNGVPCSTLGPYKFGYSTSNKVNGSGPAGEIGGSIANYGQYVAYYAKKLSAPRTLNNKLYASGSLILPDPNSDSTAIFGWFNHDSTDWRANNFLGVRITDGYSNDGGNNTVFVDSATKSGLSSGLQLKISDNNTGVLVAQTKATWTLIYDPNDGDFGTISLTMTTSLGTFHQTTSLLERSRQDGSTFDHFGLYNNQRGGDQPELDDHGHWTNGTTSVKKIYLDDLTLNTGPSDSNETYNFAADPGWDGMHNNDAAPLQDCWVHIRQDFGWKNSAKAGGSPGEIGGIIWNGEGAKQSYYATPVSSLNFKTDAVYAAGRIVINHTHPDTDIPYIGWFNKATSQWGHNNPRSLDEQNFIGVRIGGTSSHGHNLEPSYFNNARAGRNWDGFNSVEPKTIAREFWVCYVPNADSAGNGRIVAGMPAVPSAGLPLRTATMTVSAADKTADTTFDSFGIVTPNLGGAGFIEFYIDDLTYTSAPGDSGPADRCGTAPPADTTAPTVSITSPHASDTVSGTTTLAATATDNAGGSGVASVHFQLDGQDIGEATAAGNNSFTLPYDTLDTSNGSHQLKVIATDNTGLSGTNTIQITISNSDTTPPTVPTNLHSTGTTTSTIALAWDASSDNSGSGVAGYKVYRGGVYVSSTSIPKFTDSGLSTNTSYSYTVSAYDNAGNQSAKTTTVTVKTSATNPPVTGDVDGDSHVNGRDLSMVLSHFGANTNAGDADHNGHVDGHDISVVLTNFGK